MPGNGVLLLLAESDAIATLIGLAIIVMVFAGMWKVFEKAGQPGWAILIPIYNAYIVLKIAGRPGWWLLLMFIPLVNCVVAIVVSMDVAAAFGKSALFAIGLIFLGFIFFPVLGFGDATYTRPARSA